MMSELFPKRAERLERLNRESLEVLKGARLIHDVARNGFLAMVDEARTHDRTRMNQTRPIVGSTEGADDHKEDGFVAELSRLEIEVRELTHQLDRLESELRHTVSDLARERFESYP